MQEMLIRYSVLKINSHLSADHAPILAPPGPLFRDIHHGQMQHFQEVVIPRKDGFRPGALSQLAVESLDCIGGINQPADLLGVFEVGAQIRPVISPGLSDFRVFLIPLVCKIIQSIQGSGFVNRGIDLFQISHEGLYVLVADIFAGISELVDDAIPNLSFGE